VILWALAAAAVVAFILTALCVPVTRRLAARFGMVDLPGGRKTHGRPIPLLGGVAIFLGILMPAMLVLAAGRIWAQQGPPRWLPAVLQEHIPGAARRAPQALGILAGALLLHVMGLLDDKRTLPAPLKLIVGLGVMTGVVLLCDVRVLTVAGEPWSTFLSILWLAAITNALNFMDNADGLAAGVTAICAAAGQWFVAGLLCLLLGSAAGFLPYNFAPASTFMGDAGSLVLGYFLAVASCLVTYVQPGRTYYLYGIFVPLVLLAVPLYDMCSVLLLRLRERRNPMVADRRHFSHRLIRRGMSPRSAVLTIWLCTLATAVSATLLSYVKTNTAAMLIFAQTAVVLLIVAMLESANGK